MHHRVRRASGPPGAATALGLLLLAAGCGSTAGPPRAGETTGAAPDLRGVRVLVLPAQSVRGLGTGSDVDAELAYGLRAAGPEVDWIFPPEIREALARSPGLVANPDALPVQVFLEAEVERVGDPLYGELRRMAVLLDARVALLPVEVRYRPARPAGPDTPAETSGVEIVAALVNVRTGRVLWSGVVDGDPGEPSSLRALASAVGTLARHLTGQTTRPESP